MIVGMGIDMVSVGRMERDFKRRPEDLEGVFTAEEVRYAMEKKDETYHRLAARFAIKEAFIKAVAFLERSFPEWDVNDYFPPRFGEISVANDAKGRPEIVLTGRTAGLAKKLKAQGAKAHLSLSHEGEMAVGVVIIEKV